MADGPTPGDSPAQWLYRVADKAQEQFNCIKKLFLHPATAEIICATDAGREGQHIFDLKSIS